MSAYYSSSMEGQLLFKILLLYLKAFNPENCDVLILLVDKIIKFFLDSCKISVSEMFVRRNRLRHYSRIFKGNHL